MASRAAWAADGLGYLAARCHSATSAAGGISAVDEEEDVVEDIVVGWMYDENWLSTTYGPSNALYRPLAAHCCSLQRFVFVFWISGQ